MRRPSLFNATAGLKMDQVYQFSRICSLIVIQGSRQSIALAAIAGGRDSLNGLILYQCVQRIGRSEENNMPDDANIVANMLYSQATTRK